MAEARPIKLTIDTTDLRTLANLIKSLDEALTKCQEATGLAADLLASVVAFGVANATPTPDPDYSIPVTIMAGLDPATLCPECRQGKCRNCTMDGVTGEEPCGLYAAYLAGVGEPGQPIRAFHSWLSDKGLA